MTNVTRRSIAKGAAWSVPAVAVAAGAPAVAASPKVSCSTVPALSVTGVKSLTGTSGLQGTYDSANSDAGIGTYLQINAGMWSFTAPIPSVTGYRLKFGSYVGVHTVSGVNSHATAPVGGVETAQVISAGLAMSLNSQSNVPYRLGPEAPNAIDGLSIPFCVTWLEGLNPTTAGTEVGTCCYFLNYDLNQTKNLFGYYTNSPGVANSGNAYSVTLAPKYGG